MRHRASIPVGLVFYWFFDYNQSMSHRQAIIKLVQFLRENYPDVQYFNTPCLANDYQKEVYRDEEAGWTDVSTKEIVDKINELVRKINQLEEKYD